LYNNAKAIQDTKTEISTGFKWFFYDKHLKNKSAFSGQTPSRSGEGITDLSWKNIIKELGISGTPGNQVKAPRKRITGGVAGNYGSNYSIHFTGTYVPKKSGTYEFQTTSDDMSFLYIDDELIVDNGGLHWFVEKQGKKTLTEGKSYKIDIYFSEKGGDDGIDVEIKYPGDGNWSHIFDVTTLKNVSDFTTLKNVRYVWFGYEGSDWDWRTLDISQIKVFTPEMEASDGEMIKTGSLAPGLLGERGIQGIVDGFGDDKVEVSSQNSEQNTTPKKLFDGNRWRGIARTKADGTNWFRIDLGKEYSAIEKVVVYNINDYCCHDKWAGSFVKLLDSDKNLIVRSNETLPTNRTDAKNYTEDYYEDGEYMARVKTFTFGNFFNDSQTSSSSTPATYTKKTSTVLWSNKGLDINSSDGTDAGTNASVSRFYGTVDECKTKCDSFPKCKGFTYYSNGKSCWLKSSNDLNDTSSTNSNFDFYYM